ncbi:MAG: hypothetical protein AAF620_19355, partial [Bacteroidota bacterium]
ERLEDFSFNLDETKHRIYDPWGRLGWWQIDPKADLDINVSWSSYNYAYSNPIRYNDPLGDCPTCDPFFNAGFVTGAFNSLKSTITSAFNFLSKASTTSGQVSLAVSGAQIAQAIANNPGALVDAVVDGMKDASNTLQNGTSFEKGELVGGAALGVADVALGTKGVGTVTKTLKTVNKVEDVIRVMSKGELKATESTGLVRGGREGTHFASDAVSSDAKRARQRLALPQTPEVKATLEVSKESFSSPTKVQPANGMPGGGLERTATGNVPAKVKKVEDLKNTGN